MRRLFLVLLVFIPLLGAQQRDPMAEFFVSPDVIMQNQRELGVTAEQRERIKSIVSEAQQSFTPLQWDMEAETEELHAILAQEDISRDEVFAQLDKLLAVESRIKRAHLGMLIELRRALTPEQFRKARELAQSRQR